VRRCILGPAITCDEFMTNVRLFLILALAARWACLWAAGSAPHLPDRWWETMSGGVRFAVKSQKLTLNAIRDQVGSLQTNGYRVVEIFAPCSGSTLFNGLAPRDFYQVDPAIGTLEDFKSLVAACHERGMAITVFMNVGYASSDAPFFLKACDDVKAGTDSREARWFLWSTNVADTPAAPKSAYFKQEGFWKSSERAGRAYWSKWKEQPQFNFGASEWQEECKRVIRFWMDLGVDGMVVDAVTFYANCTWAINKACITGIISSYPNKWSQPEGGGAFGEAEPWLWITQGGYTSVQDYDEQTWWELKGLVAGAIQAQTPAKLDTVFRRYRDRIVDHGGVCYLYPSWELPFKDNRKRLLEIATIASAGYFFMIHGGAGDAIGFENIQKWWPEAEKAKLAAILNAVNANPALGPAGRRVRLPTNDDLSYYAFLRTAPACDRAAVVVLNYQPVTAEITVQLDAVDLLPGAAGIPDAVPAPRDGALAVKLPAYGYAFYDAVLKGARDNRHPPAGAEVGAKQGPNPAETK
jgi:hypothetical protein